MSAGEKARLDNDGNRVIGALHAEIADLAAQEPRFP
jgi:hypothetical protein